MADISRLATSVHISVAKHRGREAKQHDVEHRREEVEREKRELQVAFLNGFYQHPIHGAKIADRTNPCKMQVRPAKEVCRVDPDPPTPRTLHERDKKRREDEERERAERAAKLAMLQQARDDFIKNALSIPTPRAMKNNP